MKFFLSEEAKNQLKKLDKNVQDRIGSALERIKIRPYKFVKKLYNSQYYRARVDNYRILLDIRDTQLMIYVIYVGSRDKIYKS